MDVEYRESDGMCRKAENELAVNGVDGGKEEKAEEDGERESKSLLGANGRTAAPKRQRSARRKVQWNDRDGNKLVEVLEFQPSDSSDSDEEDDDADPCICTIM
ncbi:hypothetical protein Taro_035878 [Colocasia esculenta]|uniref:Uncharacterized protein n=1 Tax=Colocasia esculenta TaxID=4460 RepID=A0A843W535_COLES|nr:hypothetical protein [Colocasia esculenta]